MDTWPDEMLIYIIVISAQLYKHNMINSSVAIEYIFCHIKMMSVLDFSVCLFFFTSNLKFRSFYLFI